MKTVITPAVMKLVQDYLSVVSRNNISRLRRIFVSDQTFARGKSINKTVSLPRLIDKNIQQVISVPADKANNRLILLMR